MPHIAGHGRGNVVGLSQSNSSYNPAQDLNQAMIQSALNRIEQTIDSKNQPGGLSTTALNPNVQFGRDGEYNYVRDKILAGEPLTEGDKVFANFYTGNLGGAGTASGLTQYSGAMQDFKTGSPEEQAAMAIRFPNPIAKVMGGVMDYIRNASLFGKAMDAADYVGGLFTGDGKIANATNAVRQGAKDAAGDLSTMATDIPKIVEQDMDKATNAFRTFLGVKKNNSNDIAEAALGEVPMAEDRMQSNLTKELDNLNSMAETINQTGVTSDDYNQMYDFPMIDFLSGTGLPEQDRVGKLTDLAANNNNLTRTLQTSQYTDADIANAIAFPGTRQAETLRKLGIIK
jgi:hypothetical protein